MEGRIRLQRAGRYDAKRPVPGDQPRRTRLLPRTCCVHDAATAQRLHAAMRYDRNRSIAAEFDDRVPGPNLDPRLPGRMFQLSAICRTKIYSAELEHAEGGVAAMASGSAQMRFTIEEH